MNDNNSMQQELQKFELSTRNHLPIAGKCITLFCVLLSLLHIWFNLTASLPELWISAIHFGGFAIICTLLYPAHSSLKHSKAALSFDVILILAIASCVLYLPFAEDALYERGMHFVTSDWVFSLLAIAIVVELVRRTMGWFIPVLIVLCLSYVVWWGQWASGLFHFPGLSAETLLYRSFYSSEGMFGPISRISWSFVFMFILFGAFLVRSGVGDYIIAVAKAAAGKIIGGPGFVAVLGSSLMGSVSGSSVANTVSTGVITIPLMKKAGFPARFSAGVEAAASTGGQLMPPVMGAGAFIIASYTQVPYADIILLSLLPAVIYFCSVAFFVRIEAKRSGVQKAASDNQSLMQVLVSGWHNLIPLAVLVALLIQGFTPTYAAGLAILSVIVSSWFSKHHKMGPKAILEALAQGAKNMATTAILLIGIGLVVNVISTTGIGNTFSLMIQQWANGELFLMIVLIALASLILGMGLPVTASYIVLGTLSAPALYQLLAEKQLIELMMTGQLPQQASAIFMLSTPDSVSLLSGPMSLETAQSLLAQIPTDFMPTLYEQSLGIETITLALLSAHLIIFWLSQDSNVTPPVCLTAFAAATIAHTPPMRTGFTAWKIAKGLYLVPLLIAYTNIVSWGLISVIEAGVFAVLGTYAFVGALEGYLEGQIKVIHRLILTIIGLVLVWPQVALIIKLISATILVGLVVYSHQKHTALSLTPSTSP
ncbi:TRAP transporter permease [Vibrio hepatarius]|uniref:TRAP transporter permease n=1 Tax=Vibrio hepatarius TaxID=171383 RepID=UPI001C09413D|nr:TRAP transporter permease [Vibrio hepatarius]MBU2895489.1 TRAP transporter permease [Vibrio hepatarius]